MVEIEYTSLSDVVACYDTEMDIIFINKKLKQNKRVHDMVLRHELLHAKAKKNMLKHLYIDLTDNFKYLFDTEAIALAHSCDTSGLMGTYLNWITKCIVVIVLLPFLLIAQIRHIIDRVFISSALNEKDNSPTHDRQPNRYF